MSRPGKLLYQSSLRIFLIGDPVGSGLANQLNRPVNQLIRETVQQYTATMKDQRSSRKTATKLLARRVGRPVVCLRAMATKKKQKRPNSEPTLSGTVQELTEQVLVLRNAIDDLREELAWGFRNTQFSGVSPPVLKRMAPNPTASDWSDHLHFERGTPAIIEQRAAIAENALTHQLRGLLAGLCQTPELTATSLDECTSELLARVGHVLEMTEDADAEDEEAARSEPTAADTPNEPVPAKPTKGDTLF